MTDDAGKDMQWTPVSEATPSPGSYLVTVLDTWGETYVHIAQWCEESDGRTYWTDDSNYPQEWEAHAWMEIPEPYSIPPESVAEQAKKEIGNAIATFGNGMFNYVISRAKSAGFTIEMSLNYGESQINGDNMTVTATSHLKFYKGGQLISQSEWVDGVKAVITKTAKPEPES